MELVGLKMETHPNFTVEELATQLASNLQGSMDFQSEILVFKEAIRAESKKVKDVSILLDRIQIFRENPPAKVSRMEPMMQYNLEAIKEELKVYEGRISEWQDLIQGLHEGNLKCQEESIRLQRELAERNIKK